MVSQTCLAKKRACQNVKMSPSGAVSRPLSRWTDDQGWLGGSGLPTLCRKTQNLNWLPDQNCAVKEYMTSLKRNFESISRVQSYFQRSVPPSVRRVCCLVSHPKHRACRPGLQWPQCAAGLDVFPHSAEGLYSLSWNENIVLYHFWKKYLYLFFLRAHRT